MVTSVRIIQRRVRVQVYFCRVLQIHWNPWVQLNDPVTVFKEQKTKSSMRRPVFLIYKDKSNSIGIVIRIPVQSIVCPQGLNVITASFSSQILQVSLSLLVSVSSVVFFSSAKSTISESSFAVSIILEVSFGVFDSPLFLSFERSASPPPLLFFATAAVFRFVFEISSRDVSGTWLTASRNTFCFENKRGKSGLDCHMMPMQVYYRQGIRFAPSDHFE